MPAAGAPCHSGWAQPSRATRTSCRHPPGPAGTRRSPPPRTACTAARETRRGLGGEQAPCGRGSSTAALQAGGRPRTSWPTSVKPAAQVAQTAGLPASQVAQLATSSRQRLLAVQMPLTGVNPESQVSQKLTFSFTHFWQLTAVHGWHCGRREQGHRGGACGVSGPAWRPGKQRPQAARQPGSRGAGCTSPAAHHAAHGRPALVAHRADVLVTIRALGAVAGQAGRALHGRGRGRAAGESAWAVWVPPAQAAHALPLHPPSRLGCRRRPPAAGQDSHGQAPTAPLTLTKPELQTAQTAGLPVTQVWQFATVQVEDRMHCKGRAGAGGRVWAAGKGAGPGLGRPRRRCSHRSTPPHLAVSQGVSGCAGATNVRVVIHALVAVGHVAAYALKQVTAGGGTSQLVARPWARAQHERRRGTCRRKHSGAAPPCSTAPTEEPPPNGP